MNSCWPSRAPRALLAPPSRCWPQPACGWVRAFAYLSFHTDIHYFSQAALALASDWPVDDAMWIAGSR